MVGCGFLLQNKNVLHLAASSPARVDNADELSLTWSVHLGFAGQLAWLQAGKAAQTSDGKVVAVSPAILKGCVPWWAVQQYSTLKEV